MGRGRGAWCESPPAGEKAFQETAHETRQKWFAESGLTRLPTHLNY